MKQFNRYLGYVIVFLFCLGSLYAEPSVVSPRVPPRSKSAAVRLEKKKFPKLPAPPPANLLVTSTHDGVPGSLRAVLAGASPGDTIKFAVPLPATIVLSNTLVISQDVTIRGPGADELTVMRNPATNTPLFRVFDIETGMVSISGITIKNGAAFDGGKFVDNVGGGIFNRGTLTVSDCVITGNTAPTTAANAIGFGAGIFSDELSHLTLINTTISGNRASAAGGGLSTIDAYLLATGCTFSDNSAGIQGGGINFQGLVGTIENCTISGNATPPGGVGSGLLTIALEAQAAPSLTVVACTVANNRGATNGAFALYAGNDNIGLTNRLLSTVVADNDSPNFYFFGPATFKSLGHNLDSDGSSGLVNGVNNDQVGKAGSPINAKLGPLQDNGGPTFTMALLVGSPALGAGSCADANGMPLSVDQRGFPRPTTTGCDIGAYENQPLTLVCPQPIVVDFQSEAGAIVRYRALIVDVCPSVSVTYSPPPGSLFPIGETVVNVEAMDGCSSNTAACSFTVTVRSAQGVKSNVLDVLVRVYSNTTNPGDRKKLAQAIADVSDSLGLSNPSEPLWLDPMHLDPETGGAVFADEADAVSQLSVLSNASSGRDGNAIARAQINRLVSVDRVLAEVSIDDAIAFGGDPNAIAQAMREVMAGDQAAANDNPVQAIGHYYNAWALTVNL
jgi:hypothetical protein